MNGDAVHDAPLPTKRDDQVVRQRPADRRKARLFERRREVDTADFRAERTRKWLHPNVSCAWHPAGLESVPVPCLPSPILPERTCTPEIVGSFVSHFHFNRLGKMKAGMRAPNGTAPDLIEEEHRVIVRLWKEAGSGAAS